MTLDFGKVFHINNTDESEPGISFPDENIFWINEPQTPEPGWQDVTISGENSINLPNAKVNGLNYLKLYGGCVQRGVLPSGYTQLEYIIGNGTSSSTLTSYIHLDLIPNENSIMEIVATTTDQSAQFMVADANSSLNLRIAKFTASRKVGGSIGSTSYTADLDGSVPFSGKIDHKKVYINGVLIGDGSENTLGTYNGIDIGRGTYLGTSYYSKINVYYAFVSIDGINPDFLGVPAQRNSDNEVGLYDIINNTFYPSDMPEYPFSMGTVVNYPTPRFPYPIICNNGEIKANTSGQIYTEGTIEKVKDSLNNVAIAQNLLSVEDIKDVHSILDGTITTNVGIKVLTGTEDWQRTTSGEVYAFIVDGCITDNQMMSNTPACLCTHYKGIKPYSNGVAKMQDKQIKIGVKTSGFEHRLYLRDDSFSNDSTGVGNLKAYLAQQLSNGTPVIIVYPLATPIITPPIITPPAIPTPPVITPTSESDAISQGYTVVKTALELKNALVINNSNCKVMQFANINLNDLTADETGSNWIAVGTSSSNAFKGTLDGNGFTISNLKINKPETNYQGLFGYTNGATIENINLENVDVKGYDYTGGLVGNNNNSTIENCTLSGDVTGNSRTGGLVGINYNSTITNCTSSGNVSSNSHTGGLVGSNSTNAIIDNCVFSGNVIGNTDYTGGLVGYNTTNSTITNCTLSGDVKGNSRTGGLVGINANSVIENCASSGDVTGNTDYTGGLVGSNSTNAIIKNCTSSGDVTGRDYTGGLVGNSYNATINNCVSSGDVTGNSRTGGLVGRNDNATINNCTSYGNVSGDTRTGGLVGYNYNAFIINSRTISIVTATSSAGAFIGNYENGLLENNQYSSSVNTGMAIVGTGLNNPNEHQIKDNAIQQLNIQKGANTIEITQASISPLRLEAQYEAGITVTIEKIEQANLDNNVTVTIGE